MVNSKKHKKKKSDRLQGNRRLAENRAARYQYEIFETIETGIVLLGTEVKSIREGKANLKDGFCQIKNGELYLHNVHISQNKHSGNFFNHDPLRIKKLLAHRKEINRLKIQLEKKGLTIVPISIYLKGSFIKINIGIGKGKKLYDKRQSEKEKQSQKESKAAMKRFIN